MKTAMQVAGIARYQPTRHAIDRARLRFGIETEKVANWINDKMTKAKRVGVSGAKGVDYLADGVRLVVDEVNGLVITLHSELSADFLKPALERELRKIKREYTRSIRKMELAYAETLKEIAEMAVNRARACNPETRDIIAEKMADMQMIANEQVRRIERLADEKQAKIKAIEVIIG